MRPAFQCKDAPEGHPLTVVSCKGTDSGECLRCYYIRRGSFKEVDAAMMRRLIRKNPALKDKLLAGQEIPVSQVLVFFEINYIRLWFWLFKCCLAWVIAGPRFRGLRRKHIKQTARNPRARPRHETIDLRHFTEKKDEGFIDIFQDWKILIFSCFYAASAPKIA